MSDPSGVTAARNHLVAVNTFGSETAVAAFNATLDQLHRFAAATGALPGQDVVAWFSAKSAVLTAAQLAAAKA